MCVILCGNLQIFCRSRCNTMIGVSSLFIGGTTGFSIVHPSRKWFNFFYMGIQYSKCRSSSTRPCLVRNPIELTQTAIINKTDLLNVCMLANIPEECIFYLKDHDGLISQSFNLWRHLVLLAENFTDKFDMHAWEKAITGEPFRRQDEGKEPLTRCMRIPMIFISKKPLEEFNTDPSVRENLNVSDHIKLLQINNLALNIMNLKIIKAN